MLEWVGSRWPWNVQTPPVCCNTYLVVYLITELALLEGWIRSCAENCSVIFLYMLNVFPLFIHKCCFDGPSTGCVLYEPHGKVREAARNVMKLRDKTTFPIILRTARHTPHREVKQAHWVQDQCKSKCYFFSLVARLHSSVVLCWWATRHRGPAPTSEDHLTLFILWNGVLLWDVEKTR